MTAQEIQKRNERAQQLRVLKLNKDVFYVESEKGKICYKVVFSDIEMSCTCGDFTKNIKTDENFHCKHILALLNTEQGQMLQAEFLKMSKPKLNEEFITKVEGKEFVKYPGLLDLAHQKGILKIEVEALQFPEKENGNVAICKATVVSKMGETYSDLGDANPLNCSAKVAKHLLRMASTRAIARALRSFTNIGMTCLEEIGDLKDVEPGKSAQQTRKISPKKSNGNGATSKSAPKTEPSAKKEPEDQSKKPPIKEVKKEKTQTETSTPEESTTPKMSEAQKRAVMNLSRRRGISVEDVETMSQEKYQVPLENLSSKQAAEFIRNLQQAA
jgi:hypothetical protein